MKKFFMKGTDEEVQFGDRIDLNLVKETEDGIEHKSMSIKFNPLLVNMLKEEGVIEEREVKEGLDFKSLVQNNKEQALLEKISELEDRIIELEGIVAEQSAK